MERLVHVERALLRAASHDVGGVLATTLWTHYSATDVELYLLDYQVSSLTPVLNADRERVPLSTSDIGRALRERQVVSRPVVDGYEVCVPVVAKGNRVGVLTAHLPPGSDDDLGTELVELAEAVGSVVVVSDVMTDTYHRVRRSERLTVAAEIQWELLPGRGLSAPEFDLAGQLEPAYQLCGDNFDYSADAEYLTLTVTGGMGDGVDAALLTSLAINALRNARRAGLPLAEQAALADQALWAQHGGNRYVSSLLMRFELATGEVRVVDAGSPQAFLVRDRGITPLTLDAQLPLGMFAETRYVEQRLTMRRGDRLLVLSDGVFDAVAEKRRYADTALRRALTASHGLSPGEAVRTVIADLLTFHGSAVLADDAVVVCLDWFGR
ncbi:MAG: PP2C family protein-serine/threonine phosphatase [Sciscionella sp.]